MIPTCQHTNIIAFQPVVKPSEEANVEEEPDEVDVASTESLYEGDGGLDLGSRYAGGYAGAIDATCNFGEEANARNVKQGADDKCNGAIQSEDVQNLTDRILIMQKVKECYGLGVKTSLERIMRKQSDGLQPIFSPNGNNFIYKRELF